jgi:apolipoprotein D and lipocalin family protein
MSWQSSAPIVAGLSLAVLATACQSATSPMPTVSHIDLPRFMGRWYVIANIPTVIERGAHNAVESYELAADGSIATTFTYRADSFEGKLRQYHPRGFVVDRQSNALWGMRFIWPFKADYRIVYLSDDYSLTIVARQKRDYVWIMARTPQIAAPDYQRLVQRAVDLGYDRNLIKAVPQSWPEARP